MSKRPSWHWWAWMGVAAVFTALFCRGLPYHDATTFALLLIVPLLALRQAWRASRGL